MINSLRSYFVDFKKLEDDLRGSLFCEAGDGGVFGLFRGGSDLLTNSIFDPGLQEKTMFESIDSNIKRIQLWGTDKPEIPGFRETRVTQLNSHFAFLSRSESWTNIGQKNRNLVRKGKKNGVIVRDIDCESELYDFYKLYFGLLVRKRVKPHSWEVFQKIFSHKHAICKISVFNNRICAGIIGYIAGEVACYPFHASDPAALKDVPNQQLMWAMFEELINLEVSVLWLGCASRGSGVDKFKKGFSTHSVFVQKSLLVRNVPDWRYCWSPFFEKLILQAVVKLPMESAIRCYESALRLNFLSKRFDL